MSEIKNCALCEHSRFCPTWGEYKCMKHDIRKYDLSEVCEDYKEDYKKEEKTCRCETCEERGEVSDGD